jgi:hypothetical protein
LQYTQQNSTKMLISTVQFSTTTPDTHPNQTHTSPPGSGIGTGPPHTPVRDIPEPQQCAHPSFTDRHSTRAHPPRSPKRPQQMRGPDP